MNLPRPQENPKPTDKELLDCLTRSGYLMESRIVRTLTERDFFVEPNQAVRDIRSGKSREIDIIAEHNPFRRERPRFNFGLGICVKTHFVIEASNNQYPFILTTPRPSSPGEPFEQHIKFALTPEPSPFIQKIDIYDERDYTSDNLYSQFCVITQKRDGRGAKEFMASHPDDVYSSLLKMAEYVETEIKTWESFGDTDCWRLFFWQPIIVLSGDLKVVDMEEGKSVALRDVPYARFEFNWHLDDEPKTTVIDFVKESVLLEHLEQIVEIDTNLEEKILKLRS